MLTIAEIYLVNDEEKDIFMDLPLLIIFLDTLYLMLKVSKLRFFTSFSQLNLVFGGIMV